MSAIIEQSFVNSKHDPETQGLDANLQKAFECLVAYLQRGHVTESERANYADTAVRAAKAFMALTASREEITEELLQILATGFPKEPSGDGRSSGMVTQGPVQVFSLCPHHLLQVEYTAFMSYLPSKEGNVLGLSKLARIAKVLGQRPVLQEQLAADIADVLHTYTPTDNRVMFPGMTSRGSAVLLTGKHSCMTCRGVHSNALTSVTELRGDFWEDSLEQKFYQSVEAINACGLRGVA